MAQILNHCHMKKLVKTNVLLLREVDRKPTKLNLRREVDSYEYESGHDSSSQSLPGRDTCQSQFQTKNKEYWLAEILSQVYVIQQTL